MKGIFLRMLLPLLVTTYKNFLEPLINDFIPLSKQVVHVRSLQERIDTNTQYAVLDFIGLVEQHGYIAEEYNVTTDDGYILRLHRISGSPSRPKQPGKPAFYLQHGIGLSSDSWVLIGPQRDLAFLLVDAGFDVWIGNVRGNCYSRSHVSKSPENSDFWEFSYHEMAIYDVKSFIDRVLAETGVENLTYYGYSMGTTLSYVLLSTYPEYNAKINLLYSAAPVVFWRHELKRLMKIVDALFDLIQTSIDYLKLNELLPQTAVAAYLGGRFCGDSDVLTQPICVALFSNIGLDPDRFNETALPNIMAHFPAGMSKLTVYHYNQNFKRKTFAAYDYGQSKNIEKYGRKRPPVYNLTKVMVPTLIFYGKNDDIVNEKDVKLLAKRLPNVFAVKAVKHPRFNHFDFLWAKDAKKYLYDLL
ncbi:lipase 1-like [Phymastichus coffea]|uniref:lipase 1-like n=1 Tax=Phymastichus coffea TaxID=108790 RepID=UPI00273CE715|nr:lipase 1-like [Phymastichus coffea]